MRLKVGKNKGTVMQLYNEAELVEMSIDDVLEVANYTSGMDGLDILKIADHASELRSSEDKLKLEQVKLNLIGLIMEVTDD